MFRSYATSRVLPADTPLRANKLMLHKVLRSCEAQGGTWVLTCSLRTSKRRGYHRPSARRIGGLSREVSCLSRQNELDGHRPTDVTGSRRSAQKSLSGDGGRACSLPNKLAAKLFSAISPAPPHPESTSPDGVPARFRMGLAPSTGGACGLRN